MSRHLDVHIFNQLEPESIIIAGSNKKENLTTNAAKAKWDEDYIKKYGIEAWKQKMSEWRNDKKNNY